MMPGEREQGQSALDFAEGLADAARERPESTTAIGQAFVRAGLQLLVEEFGEAMTARWFAELALMLDHEGRRN